ncbi:putative WD40/YVTN repeat-like-containing domain superfamily [Plasmopara halstedii]
MKRSQTPITAFFERKQARRISIDSIDTDSDNNEDTPFSASNAHRPNHVENLITEKQKQDETNPYNRKHNATTRRRTREDLLGILQRRELVGCILKIQIGSKSQDQRSRRKQQLVRWVLSHFQRLPLELQLSPHWEQHAGAINTEDFFASCLEFDSQGVLLAAGASNGIIALYDFDEVYHRSLNLGQKWIESNKIQIEDKEEKTMTNIKLHPIHTIYTPFEVKRIRWNPVDEDEIACSFTNRNEIYVFNLRKFPSKPHKVLKSSNQPSSGYNDFFYFSTSGIISSQKEPSREKSSLKSVSLIAGDTNGAVRMWNLQIPLRPVWSFLAGSLPINALVLSANKQFLIIGNEAGMLMTYDIQRKVVPAFGSKPVPQRKVALNVMELIKPYLSPALIEFGLLSSRYGSPGIMSMRLVPQSETQVLCQLRNDWVVVIDYLCGFIVKLHTSIRGRTFKKVLTTRSSPSMLSTLSTSENQSDTLPGSRRNSWLSCHRCAGALLFDNSIMCSGSHDATSLDMIDLRQLYRVEPTTSTIKENVDEGNPAKLGNSQLQPVERLDRFRISTNNFITAVAAHPNQHVVICGGKSMELQIIGVMGQLEEKYLLK